MAVNLEEDPSTYSEIHFKTLSCDLRSSSVTFRMMERKLMLTDRHCHI